MQSSLVALYSSSLVLEVDERTVFINQREHLALQELAQRKDCKMRDPKYP